MLYTILITRSALYKAVNNHIYELKKTIFTAQIECATQLKNGCLYHATVLLIPAVLHS